MKKDRGLPTHSPMLFQFRHIENACGFRTIALRSRAFLLDLLDQLKHFFPWNRQHVSLRQQECIWSRIWPPPPIGQSLCAGQGGEVEARVNNIGIAQPSACQLPSVMNRRSKEPARVFGVSPPCSLAMVDYTRRHLESPFSPDQDEILTNGLCSERVIVSKRNLPSRWRAVRPLTQWSKEAAIIRDDQATGGFPSSTLGGEPPRKTSINRGGRSLWCGSPQSVGCAKTTHSPTEQRKEETMKRVIVGMWVASPACKQNARAQRQAGFPTHKQLDNTSAVAERPEILRQRSQLRT